MSGGLIRGNGLLHAGFPIFDLMHGRSSYIRGIASILAILAPFIAFQVYGYVYLCPDREWCDGSLPVVYSFIQSHYWNVRNECLFMWVEWIHEILDGWKYS
jgi:phosphatidylinositol glycan class V